MINGQSQTLTTCNYIGETQQLVPAKFYRFSISSFGNICAQK